MKGYLLVFLECFVRIKLSLWKIKDTRIHRVWSQNSIDYSYVLEGIIKWHNQIYRHWSSLHKEELNAGIMSSFVTSSKQTANILAKSFKKLTHWWLLYFSKECQSLATHWLLLYLSKVIQRILDFGSLIISPRFFFLTFYFTLLFIWNFIQTIL